VHELSAYCRTKIDKDTLLFFDEIQLCGKAITSLKYFNEDAPEFNVMCAGSLLGVKLAKGISFPVGKVDFLPMRPMNFKEFLIAEGEEQLVELLEELTIVDPIPPAFINRLENLYYDYLNVGGMPQVVKSWVENHNMTKVKNIQGAIIKGYKSDFGKYADVNEFTKITQIWESIPSQLAKDNKKFVFSHVKQEQGRKILKMRSSGSQVQVSRLKYR
jgi:Predicted ATPase (AAA+ superfamily)